MRGIVWEYFECQRPQAEELAHAHVLWGLCKGKGPSGRRFILESLRDLCAASDIFGRTRALEGRPKDIHRLLQRAQARLDILRNQLLSDALADGGQGVAIGEELDRRPAEPSHRHQV